MTYVPNHYSIIIKMIVSVGCLVNNLDENITGSWLVHIENMLWIRNMVTIHSRFNFICALRTLWLYCWMQSSSKNSCASWPPQGRKLKKTPKFCLDVHLWSHLAVLSRPLVWFAVNLTISWSSFEFADLVGLQYFKISTATFLVSIDRKKGRLVVGRNSKISVLSIGWLSELFKRHL